jgi:tetratricopeptide (TPR) repeat protein
VPDSEFVTSPDVAVMTNAGGNIERGLKILSAAESLTDNLARFLLTTSGVTEVENLVAAVHLCDFVTDRNSEWTFRDSARQHLLMLLLSDLELSSSVHGLLRDLANSNGASDEIAPLPTYLTAGPGLAYHTGFLDPAAALSEYSRLALEPISGQQWLAAKLAQQQQALKVLPRNVIEVDFLEGMVLYREGRLDDAIRILRKVAEASVLSEEVAIAAHLVGRYDSRTRRAGRGERLLRRSLEINEAMRNRPGLAQVLNTLGQLVGRNSKRRAEAEDLLRRSLEIEEDLGTPLGEARVLHTLGQFLGRDRKRRAEAELLLRRSLDIERGLGDRMAVAHVLNTLGQLVGRNRQRLAEAEGLLREGQAIERELGDPLGEAQILHTLGQLIGRDRDRLAEAEVLLGQSLTIGENLHRKTHQAQVLYTWARIRSASDLDEGIQMLERSLALDEEVGDSAGATLVRNALLRMRARRP